MFLFNSVFAEIKKSHKTSTHKQAPKKTTTETEEDVDEDDETKVHFKTKLARNIHRVLFEQEPAKFNDLFMPHRMAYIVDLTDEEMDVPITSIRSKADCPNAESNLTLTTNDIVINKLTQILSYLRHGKQDAKKVAKKKNLKAADEATTTKDSKASTTVNANAG